MTTAEQYRHLICNRVDPDEFVLVHYRLKAQSGIGLAEAALRTLLILTRRTLRSVGSLPTDATIEAVGAVVTRATLRGSEGPVTLALPRSMIDKQDVMGSTMLLAASAAEYSYCDDVWLEDIDFPDSLLSVLEGPHHGIDGIRSLLGVHDRPILAAALPIRHLTDQADLRQYVREVLQGGVDAIADDILVQTTQPHLPDETRVELILDEIARENDRRANSGRVGAGYFFNASASGFGLERTLEIVRNYRPTGIIVNSATMGLGAVEWIADSRTTGYQPVVLVSNMGSSMLGRNPIDEEEREEQGIGLIRTGVAEVVTAKLSRLAGADAIHTGTAGAECWHPAEFNATPTAIRDPIPGIQPAMAVAEGDVPIHEIGTNVKYLLGDVILETSTGLAGHPNGPRLGAEAYLAVATVMSPEMNQVEHDSALLLLGQRNPNVDVALESEGWRPQAVEPDSRSLLANVENASWMTPVRMEQLTGQRRRTRRHGTS